MPYYISIKDDKIYSCGETRILNKDIFNISVSLELYKDFVNNPKKYVWDSANQAIVINPNYSDILANEVRLALVEYFYQLKEEKAYGGVIINDFLIFETKKSEIGTVVASLSAMGDTETTNWKFYTVTGFPRTISITKAQLYHLVSFGRQMIDTCFAVEGSANAIVENATTEELLDSNWCEELKASVKSDMDLISNTLTVNLLGEVE